jgi:hypothetical protein
MKVGIKGCAVFEHGAGDIEEAISDGSQGPAMAVTPAAQSGVLGFALRIVLNGNAPNGPWHRQAGHGRPAAG